MKDTRRRAGAFAQASPVQIGSGGLVPQRRSEDQVHLVGKILPDQAGSFKPANGGLDGADATLATVVVERVVLLDDLGWRIFPASPRQRLVEASGPTFYPVDPVLSGIGVAQSVGRILHRIL